VQRSIRRPSVIIGALLLTLVAPVAGCTSGDKSPPPALPSTVTIGLLTPKTGAAAATGLEAIRGAELAVDVVNNPYPNLALPLAADSGLHGGVQLAVSVGDTQGAPERVEEQASRLVDEGAVGLVMADDLAVAKSASRQVDISGVALVDATSTADLFSDLNHTGHFRIAPSDRTAVQTIMDLLYRQRALGLPVGRLVTVVPAAKATPDDEVQSIRESIGDLAQADDFATGAELTFAAEPGDLINAVNNAKPGAVLAVVTTPQELAAANAVAAGVKGSTPVIAVGPAAGGAAAGPATLLHTVDWSAAYAARSPVASQVAQLYQQRYATALTAVAASAFTATMAMAMALDVAKSFSVSDVRASVQQVNIPATQTIMPWSGIRFDGTGGNQFASPIIEQQTTSGFQVVYPNELAATKIVWP
jgi:branched-chain amino acid transport system substrate-binding protein